MTGFSIHSHESNEVPQITLAALVSACTGVGVFLVYKVLLHSLLMVFKLNVGSAVETVFAVHSIYIKLRISVRSRTVFIT